MNCVKELDDRFQISKSTQNGAGRGLFAKVEVKEGDQLEIVGVAAASRDCVRYADSHSVITAEGECWVPLGFGAIVNHANNPAHQNVEYTNEPKPAYRFLRDIKEGEELLTSYGTGFANILAVYQILGAKGNMVEWEQECMDIADSKEGRGLHGYIQ